MSIASTNYCCWNDKIVRSDHCQRYAWAVPDENAIEVLAALSPIVEVGAGTGYWAKLLTQAGADVLAYDDLSWQGLKHGSWFSVAQGGPEIAAAHPDRALLLCWPPYNTPMACQALHRYAGATLAYVGEGQGGCNADDRFFVQLERRRRVAIPQWRGIHDMLTIYKRK